MRSKRRLAQEPCQAVKCDSENLSKLVQSASKNLSRGEIFLRDPAQSVAQVTQHT